MTHFDDFAALGTYGMRNVVSLRHLQASPNCTRLRILPASSNLEFASLELMQFC